MRNKSQSDHVQISLKYLVDEIYGENLRLRTPNSLQMRRDGSNKLLGRLTAFDFDKRKKGEDETKEALVRGRRCLVTGADLNVLLNAQHFVDSVDDI